MFDLAIFGSGFAGSLLAMAARRQGLSVLLLERGRHPRFAIGESTSPMANLLLEELAQRYDLPRLLPLAQYGPWKRAYPELAVGLKRGFSYYAHTPDQRFQPDPERRNELLVAASPNDELADTHWYRPDFDHFLLQEALSLGVEYHDRTLTERVTPAPVGWEVETSGEAGAAMFRARYLVDATGPRGVLARQFDLPESPPHPSYPPTQALFSHFTEVRLWTDVAPRGAESPPFPPDDAALHHVFPGGWMWVLRFENGVTSAGFAAEDWLAEELQLADRDGAWKRFRQRFPSIGEQFQEARAQLPLIHAPRLSYGCRVPAGEGWALLPSAAGFVDPLFSTGFPLTLLGIHRLASVLPGLVQGRPPERFVAEYSHATTRELAHTAVLVQGCYASFHRFPDFAWLTMLYFAAASYGEMARRLGRPDLAPGFLMEGRPAFKEVLTRHCGGALQGRWPEPSLLTQDLEPFNVAGLCDPSQRNWYGVDLGDVLRGAGKLESTPEAVQAFFREMGWS